MIPVRLLITLTSLLCCGAHGKGAYPYTVEQIDPSEYYKLEEWIERHVQLDRVDAILEGDKLWHAESKDIVLYTMLGQTGQNKTRCLYQITAQDDQVVFREPITKICDDIPDRERGRTIRPAGRSFRRDRYPYSFSVEDSDQKIIKLVRKYWKEEEIEEILMGDKVWHKLNPELVIYTVLAFPDKKEKRVCVYHFVVKDDKILSEKPHMVYCDPKK